MSAERVRAELENLKLLYEQLSDTPDVFTQWEALVQTYVSEGKQNHDARIVAAMLAHGVEKILTFNVTDFNRYSEIQVLSPRDVVGGP